MFQKFRFVAGLSTSYYRCMLPMKLPARTADRMEIQANFAEKYDALLHFKGLKGKSVASEIPHFDMPKGFVPDHMHANLLGMMMLLILWTSLSNHNEAYYLSKPLRDEIDKELKSITPPDNISRAPKN